MIELNCDPAPFAATWKGDKLFEYRKDDRGFEVGQLLRLRETVVNDRDTYSAREMRAQITYKLQGGVYGLAAGYCILGIKILSQYRRY